jgi:hypothetical protein
VFGKENWCWGCRPRPGVAQCWGLAQRHPPRRFSAPEKKHLIGEIEEIVERGPDWNTIETVVIRLSRRDHFVTVQEAREL